MPCRRTHQIVGVATGALYASYRVKDQRPHNWVAETAGGAMGGYVGGTLPDVLEPASSSWHRGAGHSLAAGGAIVSLRNQLVEWEAVCRQKAEQCRAIPMAPVSNLQGVVFVPLRFIPLHSCSRSLGNSSGDSWLVF